MEIAEGVQVIPDLLTPEECREYIELTEARGYEAAPITTAVGFVMPCFGRLITPVVALAVAGLYGLLLVVTGEIGPADLAMVRALRKKP